MINLLLLVRLVCLVVAVIFLLRGSISGQTAILVANVSAVAGIGLKPHSVLTWLFVGIMIGLDIAAVIDAIVEHEERARDTKAARR